MLKFFTRKNNPVPLSPDQTKDSKPNLFDRLKNGLKRSRIALNSGFEQLFKSSKKINNEVIIELEALLLQADIGIQTTQKILHDLQSEVTKQNITDIKDIKSILQKLLVGILSPMAKSMEISSSKKPYIILLIGVNGAGKTTSIGKLTHLFKKENKKVLLAAGDTFRAAAVEQLKAWGEQNNVSVVAHGKNADSASVIYDAIQSAEAQNVDILLADTAGRLHTQENLMQELQKIVRVIKKFDAYAPNEILLVLDGSIGQNAVQQAIKFNEALKITGLMITKLDGTAKGGTLFTIADLIKIPIRFIGFGEGIEDLKPFDAEEFVKALFSGDQNE